MNLAGRLRPQTLDEFAGQEHLIGKGRIIRKLIEADSLFSMILWGPPGSGKTTLASIISKETNSDFHHLSAVEMGKAELMAIVKKAKESQQISKKTILFIDEIHRWNKAQQDSLLPHVESGLITLIGATTENPSFEVISALLSRCRVFVLKSLEQKDLEILIEKGLKDSVKGLGKYKKTIHQDAKELLTRLCGGDARIMLNALEIAVTQYKQKEINQKLIQEVFQIKSAGLYDKKADEHYNIISAFIKSMRGSNPDAALYYLARMLENGEDPKFIARRMIIFASEDIGLADRGALIQANEAFEAVQKVGMPEAELILAHIVVYLARSPKSRATTNALTKAKEAVYEFPNEPVPFHLRNAPTRLMKSLGYAKDYTWSEKYVGPASLQSGPASLQSGPASLQSGPNKNLSFLPEKLKNKKFFEP